MTHTSSNPSECVLVPRDDLNAVQAVLTAIATPGVFVLANQEHQIAEAKRLVITLAAPTPAIAGEGLREAAERVRFALDESQSLLVAMLSEKRPSDEIAEQIVLNREALNVIEGLASPSPAVPSSDDRERLVEAMVISPLEYDALLRAREGAREKDWPGDVARLQGLIDRSQFGSTAAENPVVTEAMVDRASEAFLAANRAHGTVGYKEMRAALEAAIASGAIR